MKGILACLLFVLGASFFIADKLGYQIDVGDRSEATYHKQGHFDLAIIDTQSLCMNAPQVIHPPVINVSNDIVEDQVTSKDVRKGKYRCRDQNESDADYIRYLLRRNQIKSDDIGEPPICEDQIVLTDFKLHQNETSEYHCRNDSRFENVYKELINQKNRL